MRIRTNIYKRKDGLYEGRYQNGLKTDGTTKYNSVYAKSYKECCSKLENAKTRLKAPIAKQNLTLNDIFQVYLENKKQSTASTYHSLYDAHIAPFYGDKQISMITPQQINSFLVTRLETVTPAHVENMKRLFVALMNFAFEKQYISEQITGIIAIRVPKKIVETFNEVERQKIENYCLNDMDYISFCILLTLYTGLRIGELCALKICDFDTKTHLLKINKTMIRVKNSEVNADTKTKVIVDSPKSENSVREIPLPNFLIKIFSGLYKNSNKNAYLTTNSIADYYEPRTFENKYKKVLKLCIQNERNFHVLRHTFATECLMKNYYDIKTLSEILGHGDVLMTLRKYVHSNNYYKISQVQNIDKDWNHCNNSCTVLEKAL